MTNIKKAITEHTEITINNGIRIVAENILDFIIRLESQKMPDKEIIKATRQLLVTILKKVE